MSCYAQPDIKALRITFRGALMGSWPNYEQITVCGSRRSLAEDAGIDRYIVRRNSPREAGKNAR